MTGQRLRAAMASPVVIAGLVLNLGLATSGAEPSRTSFRFDLADDVPPFDPSHPDLIDRVRIPPSPMRSDSTPDGS